MQPDSHGAPRRSHKNNHDDHEGQSHGGGHDESNWLVSYADMMTLLFGFFVLMYSFSKIDNEKFEVVRKDMVKYFGGKLVNQPGAPEGPQKLTKELDESLQRELGSGGDYNVKLEGNTLILTIGSDLLFPSGSAQLSDSAVKVIEKIYNTVKNKKIDLFEVEGHTDSDAISTLVFPSNWELSAARAASVVRIFEKFNVRGNNLKVTGYGSSRPLPDQKNEKGELLPHDKKKDRRVVLNMTVDPKYNLKADLESSGLSLNERNLDPKKAALEEKAKSMQDKFEEMNLKMKEAAEKLAKAKEEQKRLKALEMLAKKTADMENKIKEIEKKTEGTLSSSPNSPSQSTTGPSTTQPEVKK